MLSEQSVRQQRCENERYTQHNYFELYLHDQLSPSERSRHKKRESTFYHFRKYLIKIETSILNQTNKKVFSVGGMNFVKKIVERDFKEEIDHVKNTRYFRLTLFVCFCYHTALTDKSSKEP